MKEVTDMTYAGGYNWFAFAIVIYVLLVIILNAGFFGPVA
ncbi:MAG: hypothetical protein BSOLF_0496 [Candidatus Carbobacillus altaicus]|uniref:Uncharacterized protein n=1 Tax=Candidatus Carbonibacillus altaicus TaxID=2163959 RepID=A0A2R6Y0W2_9BACL|nr:MAG: hypothetical protein BSOLF_0496 [Candidatus Carbobacillus altaicus]